MLIGVSLRVVPHQHGEAGARTLGCLALVHIVAQHPIVGVLRLRLTQRFIRLAEFDERQRRDVAMVGKILDETTVETDGRMHVPADVDLVARRLEANSRARPL